MHLQDKQNERFSVWKNIFEYSWSPCIQITTFQCHYCPRMQMNKELLHVSFQRSMAEEFSVKNASMFTLSHLHQTLPRAPTTCTTIPDPLPKHLITNSLFPRSCNELVHRRPSVILQHLYLSQYSRYSYALWCAIRYILSS